MNPLNCRFTTLGRTLALSAVLATSILHTPAFAFMGPPGVAPSDRNAAIVYWKGWSLASEEAMRTDIDWAAIGSNLDPAKMPESFMHGASEIQTRRDSVQTLIQASRLTKCDFELAYEDGFALLLPHIGKMRGGARYLRIDARRLMMENKGQEAAGHIAAMFRMSQQLKNDGVLISSLVGMAIASIAIDEGTVLIDSGRLKASEASELREAVKSVMQPDAFGVRACVAGEGELLRGWIAGKFSGKSAGADLLKMMDFALEAPASDQANAATEAVRAMDASALNADIATLLKGYSDVNAAWTATDAEKKIEQIAERSSNGEYGHLAVLAFPSFARARANVDTNAQKVKAFATKLDGLK
jgi:hypothetical protein